MGHGGMEKLYYRNSWEHDEFYVGDDGKASGQKRVTSLRRVLVSSTYYDVQSREVTKSYSDMGTTMSATSTHYFINAQLFGRNIEFDLGELMSKYDIPVFAVEWEEEE